MTHAASTELRGTTSAQAARRCVSLVLGLLLTGLGAGCRVVQSAADLPASAVRTVTPGQKDKPTVNPVEVQQALLRFADEFSARMVFDIELLRRGANPMSRAEMLRWKIAFDTETTSIVTGPNAIAGLLDMTVFVTATRAALEEHWQPRVFGASAQPMLDGCRNAQTNIWRFAGTVLTSGQQADLRRAIELWRRQNPSPEGVLAARAVGFAAEVAEKEKTGALAADSLLNLLKVDPLAGLDPAMREIAQTRLFAERALYVTQKMPTLLRWQTELLSLNAVEMPEVRQLVTNSTQITASVERFVGAVESLPKLVSTEREEILKALQAQEKNLTPLVNEVRQTLATGTQMSTSLNTTLTTFDAVMKRFGLGETNNASPPQTNAEPFRIQDYTKTAAQLEATARQLTELLITLDRTIGSTNLAQLSAQVGPVVRQVQTGGKEITDYAFRNGLLFLIVACAAALTTVLIYRFLNVRFMSANSPKTSSR
jgi:hypothetical protein